MKTSDNRLTSPEITNLFVQYNQETMSIYIDKHVLATVKDPDICSVFEYALSLSKKHVEKLKEFFSQKVSLHQMDLPIKA